MKVIKKGREQTGWSKEAQCTGAGNGLGGCGAILLVELADVFETTQCARDEVDYFVTFRCSECNVLTDLPGCPPHVRAAASDQKAKWHQGSTPVV